MNTSSFQVTMGIIGTFVLFGLAIVFITVTIRDCHEEIIDRGLKNILQEDVIDPYWEGDSSKTDSTKEMK